MSRNDLYAIFDSKAITCEINYNKLRTKRTKAVEEEAINIYVLNVSYFDLKLNDRVISECERVFFNYILNSGWLSMINSFYAHSNENELPKVLPNLVINLS